MIDQSITSTGFLMYGGLFLHATIVIFGIWFCVHFFKRIVERDNQKTKQFFIFITLFFLFMTVSYVMRIIMVFFVPQTEEQFISELLGTRTENTQGIAVIYAFSIYLSISSLTAGAEKSAFRGKSKYLFSILIITICLIIGLLMITQVITYETATFIQFIPMIIGIVIGSVLAIVYIRIGIKNTGIIRKKSISVGIGIFVYIWGVVLSSKGILNNELIGTLIIPMIISPLFILIGYGLLFIGYRKISD